ncbi:hypothetical protein J6590_030002 [Homalodisca vitripennis]|nr:hypothetical protein J6590_030002 [Homalodisca vitripennis]
MDKNVTGQHLRILQTEQNLIRGIAFTIACTRNLWNVGRALAAVQTDVGLSEATEAIISHDVTARITARLGLMSHRLHLAVTKYRFVLE